QEDYDPLEKEGGRGLMFMNQLTDEVSYQRLSDQRNCLLMRKWC
ncbi:MAG: ATP-binding protein, partial [Moorea sp. SIO4A3]|nr:ATP-binding protein [Moorena sp. SIO4A3]